MVEASRSREWWTRFAKDSLLKLLSVDRRESGLVMADGMICDRGRADTKVSGSVEREDGCQASGI